MSFERKRWNERVYHNELSERYFGKVQYLRQDHGYIRSKTKINGIRDVTFNFSDVHAKSLGAIQIGDIVSFRVNIYSSGKFCAIDIRKESDCTISHNQTRSGSPLSFGSIEHTEHSDNNQFMQESDSEISSCSSSNHYIYDFTTEPFIISSCKQSEEKDPFSRSVDSFLEKVISRNYSSLSTCWLTV